MKQKRYINIFVYIFCIVLVIGFLGTVLKKENEKSIVEGRKLASQPNLTIDKLISGEAYKELDNFFDDQIIGRDLFQETYYKVQGKLGKNNINNIIKGKDDYLFEAVNYTDLNKEYIEHNITKIEELNTYLRNKGKKLYIAVAPGSANINQSKMPAYFNSNEDEYLNIFFDLAPKELNIIDLREVLRSSSEKIYYNTDHHWNMKGAFLGYQKIIDIMNEHGENLGNIRKEEDYTKEYIKNFYGSYARKNRNAFNKEAEEIEIWLPKYEMGEYYVKKSGKDTLKLYDVENIPEEKYSNLYTVVYNGLYPEVKYQFEKNRDKESILIMGDSYMLPLPMFISDHFYRTYTLYLRQLKKDIDLAKYVEDREIENVLLVFNAHFVLAEKLHYALNK